jgi:quercetin dioxygenase-like cupin family protein
MEKPSGFELRTVTMEVGAARIYNEAEWRDALVVVARGEIELEAVSGDSRRVGRGSVLCLVGLSLRALRSRGPEPAVLVAVARQSGDEFFPAGSSKG